MVVDKLWESWGPDYINNVIFRGHQYENIIGSRLELAVDVKDLQILMDKQAVTAQE